jgi:hypothetical protein
MQQSLAPPRATGESRRLAARSYATVCAQAPTSGGPSRFRRQQVRHLAGAQRGWRAADQGSQRQPSGEIDAAFARLAHDRGDDVYANDVLFVSADALFQSRSQQLVALTARDRIPAVYTDRAAVAAGGLMSYGTDIFEMYRQIGLYTGTILKGTAKPADLPVQQSTKFELVVNRKTAKALGLDIPLMLRVAATELND